MDRQQVYDYLREEYPQGATVTVKHGDGWQAVEVVGHKAETIKDGWPAVRVHIPGYGTTLIGKLEMDRWNKGRRNALLAGVTFYGDLPCAAALAHLHSLHCEYGRGDIKKIYFNADSGVGLVKAKLQYGESIRKFTFADPTLRYANHQRDTRKSWEDYI